MNQFPNKAGDHTDTDDILTAELKAAGILVLSETESPISEGIKNILREQSGEVKTSVRGSLHGWTFERAWYYWIAKGPGIELSEAQALQAKHSKVVRVAGHCGSPSPLEWFKGLAVGSYHVDSPEGLKALADTIKKIVELQTQSQEIQFLTKLADLIDQYDACIGYSPIDDGLHISIAGKEIWNGWIYRFENQSVGSQSEDLRQGIAELTGKNNA